MAIFRCNRSGNTISVTREDDIARMRKQENYTEVLNEDAKTEETPKTDETEVLKPRGRPRKVA